MSKEYDLVILGGGTGGYVAAIRAAQLGKTVAIVENEKLGGTCLHKGCIPSKSLLRSAEVYRQMNTAIDFGIETSEVTLHFDKVQNRKNKVVTDLHNGVKALINKNKISVYEGYGRILGPSIFSPIPGTISVEHGEGQENTMLLPKNIIIATGSRPISLPNLDFDHEFILSSDDILEIETLPKSIIIVGAGVIGIEFASLLTDLGVEVTVVENSNEILATEDTDIQREVEKQLKKRGVQFMKSATLDVESVHKDSFVTAKVNQDGETIALQADKMLVCVGRKANIDEIGLANTSINIHNKVIETTEFYQTKESHIYAIGDCIGGLQLAHVASAEGIVAVEHMAGLNPDSINPLQIPTCVYAFPEVAKIGLTEKEASEQGYEVKVGKFPFQGIGKAQVYGDTTGFSKIIVDGKTDDILGVHLIGPHVTDMISEAGIAKVLDASAWEISKTIHPHPSLSEVLMESALAVDNVQIHG